MTKAEILVLADIHGRTDLACQALGRLVKRPDAVLFLGDGLNGLEDVPFHTDLFCVRGNCDYGPAWDHVPKERTVDIGGVKIFMTHGHLYGVKSGIGRLCMEASARGADAVLFGHTHEPFEEPLKLPGSEKTVLLMNPGSLCDGCFGTLTVTDGCILAGFGRL
ncbi:MAG: YfcE family phosphodiesterase [Clostridia bacterium]|nr:YfcE family phosphodiesterase [Clostridia bacterium]